jgi:ABC-type nitrate/sulfonate/bicarbonate transport system substrate-binding protein
MKKSFWITGIVVVLALVAVWIGSSNKPSDYVVKIGYLPITASQLPLEIAQQKKFFEDQGITVQATQLQTSNQIVDALARGDIDLTPEISILPYLNAEMVDPGKMKIIALTDITSDVPFDSLLVKENSTIKTLEDLKGKKIGVFPGTSASNMFKLFLKEKGIDSSTIQFVQLPPPQHLTALTAGSIDALFTYEPTISIALTSGGIRKIYGSVYSEQLEHSPLGVALVSTQFVNNHPREAKKAVNAFDRAFDYLHTNDKDVRDMTKTLFKLDQKVVDVLGMTYFRNSQQIDKTLVAKLLDILVASGEFTSKPDLTNAYYK